jgi:3-oxoacyl-[acyl-carrier protein] reductase
LVGGVDEEAWRKGLEVDVLGTVRAVEAAMPFLEDSNDASIVAISSTAAVNTSGGVRAYSGVKAALISYMSGLSTACGGKGIRANTVSPGAIYFEGGVWDVRKRNDPKAYDAAVARNPMKRLGTPEEVANGAVFLASPAASFISGTNLIVDGAATTRVQF